MKIKKDQITGLVLVLLGLAVAVLVSQFKKEMTAAYPGPKLFPLIAAFGFVVCGMGIFLTSTVDKKEEKVFLAKTGWLKLAVLFALMCAYIFFMKYFGYLIVTPFVLFAASTLIAKGGNVKSSLVGRIVFSVVFSVIVYVMYVHMFSMTLPSGILF